MIGYSLLYIKKNIHILIFFNINTLYCGRTIVYYDIYEREHNKQLKIHREN